MPFKISTLLFFTDSRGRLLLIERAKAPNAGCWSPPGGKLEMAIGESPFETAVRETEEELDLKLSEKDFHLFAYLSEKGYEGQAHWLMFFFRCLLPIDKLPATIDEGPFAFFERSEIDTLKIPPTDHDLVWPFWDQYRDGFVAMRADCRPGHDLSLVIEQASSKVASTNE